MIPQIIMRKNECFDSRFSRFTFATKTNQKAEVRNRTSALMLSKTFSTVSSFHSKQICQGDVLATFVLQRFVTLSLQILLLLICACDQHLDASHQENLSVSLPLVASLRLNSESPHTLAYRSRKPNRCLALLQQLPNKDALRQWLNQCRHARDDRQGAPSFLLHFSPLQRAQAQ